MSSPPRAPRSYLIIGAGTFGAATALSLKKSEPGSDVTVLDQAPFPCPMGAGHDYNKIVRADYDDLLYMKLGLKSMESWNSDPLYSTHFHKTGFLWSENVTALKPVMDTWSNLRDAEKISTYLTDPSDVKHMFNGIFRESDWSKITKCMMCPEAGWVDSAGAIESVMEAAVGLGVKYIASGAEVLTFDDTGACVGAKTQDGQLFVADRTVLAAGAHIPFILAESAPRRPEIHAGDRLVAVGAPMAAFKIPNDQMEKFDQCPVHGLAAALPAELIPPGKNQLLKCTHESAFTHHVVHEKTQQRISIPPRETDQQTWSQDMPQILKDELMTIFKEYFGDWLSNSDPESYRMCWDGWTRTQNWLICPHPHAANLYIAGGGSFHGFKFLPVIGDLIVQMIRGELHSEMRTRWAWDEGPQDGGALPEFWPKRDLGELWEPKGAMNGTSLHC